MADLMQRLPHITVDEFGIDPLRDTALELLDEITDYRSIELEQMYVNNAPLLSYDEYGTVDAWWIILAFNGIGRMYELSVGLTVKIPSHAQVISILSKSAENKVKTTSPFDTNAGTERVIQLRDW